MYLYHYKIGAIRLLNRSPPSTIRSNIVASPSQKPFLRYSESSFTSTPQSRAMAHSAKPSLLIARLTNTVGHRRCAATTAHQAQKSVASPDDDALAAYTPPGVQPPPKEAFSGSQLVGMALHV